MKLIIDIDKEDYENIKSYAHEEILPIGWIAIANGTPLPKGHGRLIDADALLDKQWEEEHTHEYIVYADDIDDADIIIEAERKVKENV